MREADSANARGGERTIERPDRVGSHPSPAPSPLVEKMNFLENPNAVSFPQSRGAVAPPSAAEESGRSKANRPANLNPSWDLSTSEDAYVGHFPNDLSLS